MSQNLVSTEILMKMVDIVQPQTLAIIEKAECAESLKKRYEFYLASLIALSNKSRLMLFLAARALIAEGADPLSVKLAFEEIQTTSPAEIWLKVVNEDNTLARLQDAITELTPIVGDVVSLARRASSVENRYDEYLGLMVTLVRNTEIRLFLLCSCLAEAGGDIRSVEAAASTYSEGKELW